MKRIAIKQPSILGIQNLKQEYLLFDEVFFDFTEFSINYESFIKLNPDFLKNKFLNEIESLFTKQILQNISISEEFKKTFKYNDKKFAQQFDDKGISHGLVSLSGNVSFGYLMATTGIRVNIESNRIERALNSYFEKNYHESLIIEIVSNILNYEKDNIEFLPIIDRYEKESSNRENVISIVFKKFPIPIEQIEWERLREFKNNPKTSKMLEDLRRWITERINLNSGNKKVEEEIDYLLNQFEDNYRLHKMKYKYSKQKIICSFPFDIMKLNLKNVMTNIYDLKILSINKNIDENKLLGREVAFISEVNKKLKHHLTSR